MIKRKLFYAVALVSMIAMLYSCDADDLNKEPILYEGPLLEADSVKTLYSDSGLVRVMVEAPKQFEFASGDREFPQGIYIEFYEPDGVVSSTLIANKGYFFKEESRYTGIGDVVVRSIKDDNMLLTDTLHYATKEKTERQIYTKDSVTIIEGADTLRGTGLEASRDFSSYTILNPIGSTEFKDDAEDDDEND